MRQLPMRRDHGPARPRVRHGWRRPQRWRGGAAVEFLLCLPLLILLAFPVADLARVLQADMILTGMAREGANLASRTSQREQDVMEALAATALPLDMGRFGAIRITRVLAARSGGVVRNVVVGQYRWGSSNPGGGVWACGAGGTSWNADGSCGGLPPPQSAPSVNILTGQLAEGDMVYLVEVFYRFPLLFGAGSIAPAINPDLYAMAVF